MARPYRGPVTVNELILLPAIFTFFVTIVRLIGELVHGPQILFGSEAGGGGSIIGISWLIPIFAIYFAVRQVQNGVGPSDWTRAFLWFPLALVVLIGGFALPTLLGWEETDFVPIILVAAVTSVISILVASRGWSFLFKPLLAYGLAARIPVAVIMLPAIYFNWGTHYDVAPGLPPMNFFLKWIVIGLIPQMTIWIALTVVGGGFLGAIVGGIMQLTRKKP